MNIYVSGISDSWHKKLCPCHWKSVGGHEGKSEILRDGIRNCIWPYKSFLPTTPQDQRNWLTPIHLEIGDIASIVH